MKIRTLEELSEMDYKLTKKILDIEAQIAYNRHIKPPLEYHYFSIPRDICWLKLSSLLNEAGYEVYQDNKFVDPFMVETGFRIITITSEEKKQLLLEKIKKNKEELDKLHEEYHKL